MEGRSSRQVSKIPRTAGHLPHQIVLHLQHAHYSSDRAGVQPVLCLPSLVQPRSYQRPRPTPGQVAGHGGWRRIPPRGRNRVLHQSSSFLCGDYLRSLPRRILSHLHPNGVRPLLQDVDRGVWRLRPRCRQAAPGQSDGHEGTPRQRPHSRPQSIHPHRRGVRRNVHRCVDGRGRFHGSHWYRYRYSLERHHYLSVLRGVLEGAG
mmetsp:Transcript_17262/g.50154  ORF Transcript_17262/g.50154 Transcript_17262/m.50154 type:complete len:205 (+) Transcript_17262:885-1499(+)